MSSTLLERTRAFHEDIEAYERAVIEELKSKPKSHKQRVLQQHRVAALLDEAAERSRGLHDLYKDEDGTLKEEIAAMRGRDALKSFGERTKETLNYHARHPNIQVQNGPDLALDAEARVAFSGEELYGKFFDLHGLFARWINLPQCKDKKLDYLDFLAQLSGPFEALPEAEKARGGGGAGRGAYGRYVGDLGAYLEGFLRRTQPLVDVKDVRAEARCEFEAEWAAGKAPGWPPVAAAAAMGAAAAAGREPRPLDLSKYRAAEELLPLGMERLKEALEALELKCGGTLQQRADRLWSVCGVPPDQIDKKLRAKRKTLGGGGGNDVANGGSDGGGGGGGGKKRPRTEGGSSNGAVDGGDVDANGDAVSSTNGHAAANGHADGAAGASSSAAAGNGGHGRGGDDGGDPRKELAWQEAWVRALLAVLSDVWDATRRQVEKRQTLTVEEREAEIREEEEGVGAAVPEAGEGGDGDGGDESDDDGPIYNPKNLPLGYDGKPIAYWLYKLHGLGVEYKCEICGDFSYWGRRAFDRHFQEGRHSHGMKCLGIPNTKHFHDITLIQDAQDLYNKIRHTQDLRQFNAEAEEEYEDAEGNVLKRRTFQDLARQGLL